MKCQVLNRPYSPIYICQPFTAASTVGILHLHHIPTSSVQFSSVVQSCLILCDSMDCSTTGFPVDQQLPELAQTHVHWVSDVIQTSHPLLSPSSPACSLSQHQGLFQGVSSSHSIQFSRSVMSDSLQHYEPQHARPPCPSPTPGVYPNPCPLSWWCNPTISSSVFPFSSCSQSVPVSGSFPMSQLFSSGGQSILGLLAKIKGSIFPFRWPKFWSFSFSISPSNEYSGLISFRMDWFDLLSVQGTLKSLLQTPQFKSINSLALSFGILLSQFGTSLLFCVQF